MQGILDEGGRRGRGLAVRNAKSDLSMGEPAEPDQGGDGGDPAELQADPLPHKTAFQPPGGMKHGFRGTRQRGGKSQPEGVAVLQVRHDLHGRFRVMGQIVLDLDPPRGIELLVHIGEEIGFGDGIRHRILR